MTSMRNTVLPVWQPQDVVQVVSQWAQNNSRLAVLALVCEADRTQLPALQQALTQAGHTLLGAVVPGLVTATGVARHGVLLMECSADWPHRLIELESQQGRSSDAAIQALADLTDQGLPGGEPCSLLMLIDAMVPDTASLVDRLYLEVGDQIHYVGSSVGSETFQTIPCVFDNSRVLQDAVLALLVPSPSGSALAHSYQADRMLRVATATSGNRIRQIDGRPAFEVYQEMMAKTYGIALTHDNFYQHAVHFPLALNRAQGEPLVRIPVLAEPDGSVFCIGEVPQNALLGVVRAIAPGSLDTAQTLGAWSRQQPVPTLLLFYCAGRTLHLGEPGVAQELAQMSAEVAPRTVLGALSLGEIANMGGGYPAFHNATMVVLPWV